MLSTKFLIGALGLVSMVVATAPALAHSLKDFEGQLLEREAYVEVTKSQAPAFSLTDAEGRTVSLSDLRSKVLVLYFVYARCKELCPLQNDFIAFIQERLNATPVRDQVQFVTIVTDAEDAQETAEIIRGFPRRHGFDTSNWVVLYRGGLEPDATIKLAEKYGVKFSYTEEGDQLHGVVTYLIDGQGVLRARYHGLNFNPANLIDHVNALASDHPVAAADSPSQENSFATVPLRWLSDNRTPVIAAVGAVALVGGVCAVVLLMRRRRRGTAAGETSLRQRMR